MQTQTTTIINQLQALRQYDSHGLLCIILKINNQPPKTLEYPQIYNALIVAITRQSHWQNHSMTMEVMNCVINIIQTSDFPFSIVKFSHIMSLLNIAYGYSDIIMVYCKTKKVLSLPQTIKLFRLIDGTFDTAREKLINFVSLDVNIATPNTEVLEIACSYDMTTLIQKYIHNRDMFTQKCLHNAIRHDCFNTCQLIIPSLFQLDSSLLEMACHFDCINVTRFILDNKIAPTSIAFNNVYQAKPIFPYVHPQQRSGPPRHTIRTQILNLLISYGFKPSRADIMATLHHKHVIENLSSFGITFGDEFIKECAKSGHIPYKEYKIKPTIECLEYECSVSNNFKQITTLVKKDGLKPTIECLRNACKIKNNVKTMQFLIEQCDVKPDNECLKNLATVYKCAPMSYVLGIYDVT